MVSTLHDLPLAAQYADRLLLLSAGRVAASGRPEEVLTAASLAEHYGARADVTLGPNGVRVHPLRATTAAFGHIEHPDSEPGVPPNARWEPPADAAANAARGGRR